ncbi:sarcosine oxidase like protein [Zymoseptoria brevis]|uniref:Sarcosine oxidase like protein n=1 Tax=Zymoseptoria brevis TaxID=1047168 RepID=A0A0F4GI89_9PEZI|nr:sarcosine oxidase like protein [Zymoseptoria brevis]
MDSSILIIGAGTFGTSTAYHLAQTHKNPSKITILDSAPSPSNPAAAIDVNRIIRTDYPNSLYCDLACEAIHSWFWSIELGPCFHKVGWLMLDEKGSTLSDRILATFAKRGSTQAERVELERLAERWEVLKDTNMDGFRSAYFNPEAGWCDAASATSRFLETAEKKGVRRVTGKVAEFLLDQKNGRVEGVKTEDGRVLKAEKVILATGAWTSSLLSPVEDILGIPEEDRIERQVQATGIAAAYYRVSSEEVTQLTDSKLPCMVYGGQGEVIPPSQSNQLLKYSNSQRTFVNTVITSSGRKITMPPANQSQYEVPEAIKRETEEIITSKVLPSFAKGKKADYWRICWDAQTPSEDWLMCKHPHQKLSNLYLAVGGSFHAYKFLPNFGKYMVNVLQGISNGEEKDRAWSWKSGQDEFTDEHSFGLLMEKSAPRRELRDLERASGRTSSARL